MSKNARIKNLQARIMQLEHVMRRAIGLIPTDPNQAIDIIVVAHSDDTITKDGEWNEDSPTLREMAAKYPQNQPPLGPWMTPRSIHSLSDILKNIKASKVDADDLKGFQHPDHPPSNEMPKWFSGTPMERGTIKLDDEYPNGWDKIDSDEYEREQAISIKAWGDVARALAKKGGK